MKNRKQIIILLIILLAIGFAAVSTTLVLNGVINIASNNDDFNVIFTSAKLDGKKRNDFISSEKKEIIFETRVLTTLEEETVLEYEVTNTSRNYDANVKIACDIVDEEGNKVEEENIYIDLTYEPTEMTVLASETKKGKIRVRLIKVTTEDMTIKIKSTLNAEATERDELADEYVEPFSKSGVLANKSYLSNNIYFWEYRSNITRVEFENKMIAHDTAEDLKWDVSSTNDGSVMAYLVANGEELTIPKDAYNKDLEDTTAYTLYIQSETGVKAHPTSTAVFYEFNNLVEIINMKYFDTSNVKNMSWMFAYCNNLISLDVSHFDTRNVSDMSAMFRSCRSLTKLNLDNFDTSSLTTIGGFNYFYGMFSDCINLTELNISNFDFLNITDNRYVFYNMSDNAEIIVKNKKAQDWIIALNSDNRPSAWTTDNVKIKIQEA